FLRQRHVDGDGNPPESHRLPRIAAASATTPIRKRPDPMPRKSCMTSSCEFKTMTDTGGLFASGTSRAVNRRDPIGTSMNRSAAPPDACQAFGERHGVSAV